MTYAQFLSFLIASSLSLLPHLSIASEQLKASKADGVMLAQSQNARAAIRNKPAGRSSRNRSDISKKSQESSRVDSDLARANKLATSGQFVEASKLLYQLSRNLRYADRVAQIRYVLGLVLLEMKFNQGAAFMFYDVIRHESQNNPKSKYLRQSLGKLALAADALDSDVLLRYAIKQVSEDEFPVTHRDMLAYRIGEIKLNEKDFSGAAKQFAQVRPSSTLFNRARYKLGLAFAESGESEKALGVFEDLAVRARDLGVTDRTRVSALLGRARVLYQKKDFQGALEAYRDIPRDTELWHEALFESSWAMLRDGRFRSALSNFHSLHSTFYNDQYQPESLLLRAIVYLYICRHDEMEKVLELFDRIYKPVQRDVRSILNRAVTPEDLFRELVQVSENFDGSKSSVGTSRGLRMPLIVAREILKEGDVRRSFAYLGNLENERKQWDGMPATWRSSGVGQYVKKLTTKRIEATHTFAGNQIRRHLVLIQNELRDHFEQSGFLRFEMLSGKKEAVRKEMVGKGLERPKVDQSTERDYYVQNGYEYWPFTGEYWLDEIGNYHYVGVKACE
jgi:tetratricopeptide (TPR) repeat protein